MKRFYSLSGWVLVGLLAGATLFQTSNLFDVNNAYLIAKQRNINLIASHEQLSIEYKQKIENLEILLQNSQQAYEKLRKDFQNESFEATQTQQSLSLDRLSIASTGNNSSLIRPNSLSNSPRLTELSSRMILNARYGQFINSLNLSSDEENQLRELMMTVINEQDELNQLFATGEISLEVYQELIGHASMDLALDNFLTEEEFDLYYEYEDQEDNRARQKIQEAMKMQIAVQAPNLSEKNRNLISDFIEVEMKNMLGDSQAETGFFIAGTSAVVAGPDEVKGDIQQQVFTNQEQIFDRVREKLQGSMDDEQMAIAEGYLDQQLMQLEMAREMIFIENATPSN